MSSGGDIISDSDYDEDLTIDELDELEEGPIRDENLPNRSKIINSSSNNKFGDVENDEESDLSIEEIEGIGGTRKPTNKINCNGNETESSRKIHPDEGEDFNEEDDDEDGYTDIRHSGGKRGFFKRDIDFSTLIVLIAAIGIIITLSFLGIQFFNGGWPFPPKDCHVIDIENVDLNGNVVKLKNVDKLGKSISLFDIQVYYKPDNEEKNTIDMNKWTLSDNDNGERDTWAPEKILNLDLSGYRRPGELTIYSSNALSSCPAFYTGELEDTSTPKIFSIDPLPKYVNDFTKDWVVTITGQSLKQNLKARLNGNDRIATYKNDGTIQVQLLESDDNSQGDYKLSLICSDGNECDSRIYSIVPKPTPAPPTPTPKPIKYDFTLEGSGEISLSSNGVVTLDIIDNSSNIRMCNETSCKGTFKLMKGDKLSIESIISQNCEISINPKAITDFELEKALVAINGYKNNPCWIQGTNINGYNNLIFKNMDLTIIPTLGEIVGKFNSEYFRKNPGEQFTLHNIGVDSMGSLTIKKSGLYNIAIKGAAEYIT